jgi:hypothetical protein
MTDVNEDPRKKDRSATRVRAVRVSDEVWEAALDKAKANGETVAEVVRAALVKYVGAKVASPVHGRGGGRDKKPREADA